MKEGLWEENCPTTEKTQGVNLKPSKSPGFVVGGGHEVESNENRHEALEDLGAKMRISHKFGIERYYNNHIIVEEREPPPKK